MAAFGRYCHAIEQRVLRENPAALVLSSELLFRPPQPGGLARLRDWLRSLSADFQVVAYVRRPSHHFMASVQQQLRVNGRPATPRPLAYRDVLEPFQETFGDRLVVLKYERAALCGEDIVTDFTSRFLPELGEFRSPGGGDVNAGSSAEVLAIMQELYAALPPRRGCEPRPALQLEYLLNDIARTEGIRPTLARLHPHIASAIDRQSIDRLWLRSAFGIVFDELDYETIGTTDSPEPALKHPLVRDICPVDGDTRAQLLSGLARRMVSDPDNRLMREAGFALMPSPRRGNA